MLLAPVVFTELRYGVFALANSETDPPLNLLSRRAVLPPGKLTHVFPDRGR